MGTPGFVMPAQAGMTAMDGGNAIGLQGATLAHYNRGHDCFKYCIAMDPGSGAGMTGQ
jgi:hypothetical protein